MRAFQTLILDYGGVYSFEYTTQNYRQGMRDAFGAAPSDVQQVELRPAFAMLSTGRIDVAEYIGVVKNLLNPPRVPTESEFARALTDATLPPSPEMVRLRKAVQEANIRAVLLSDMCEFELTRTELSGRYDGFDNAYFSARTGVLKCERNCFRRLVRSLDLVPDATLFVDDSIANITSAESVGLETLFASKMLYSSPTDLEAAVMSRLGLDSRSVHR